VEEPGSDKKNPAGQSMHTVGLSLLPRYLPSKQSEQGVPLLPAGQMLHVLEDTTDVYPFGQNKQDALCPLKGENSSMPHVSQMVCCSNELFLPGGQA
jgi:hypothetical protein